MNCSRPLRVTVVLVGIALGVAIAEIVLGLVGRMHTFLAARFLAVILSNPIQVYPDAVSRDRHLAAVGGTDLFYPERRFQALGARKRFDVLALAPLMQREAERRRIFFHGFANTKPGVGHWNAAGHEFAGRAIASTVCGAHRRAVDPPPSRDRSAPLEHPPPAGCGIATY